MWSLRFETWASPLSDTADQKCQNAESVIRSAIDKNISLAKIEIKVFAQGSYKANTNVRDDSDVDICVCNKENFYYNNLPSNFTTEVAGIGLQSLSFTNFKIMVGTALYDRFGYQDVTKGNKAYTVHANTYRIKADVVPTFEYRNYFQHEQTLKYISGVCFLTDNGELIINWPEQTLANGRSKNENTKRRYKKVVRVLKGLRYEMETKNIIAAKKVSSFQIACLAYNISGYFYSKDELIENVEDVAGQIWYNTLDATRYSGWTEIDEIKPIFRSEQQRIDCNDFFWELKKYVGFV